MDDLKDLKILLAGMCQLNFPDRTKDIIKSFQIMANAATDSAKKGGIIISFEDTINCIASSLAYVAINRNLTE